MILSKPCVQVSSGRSVYTFWTAGPFEIGHPEMLMVGRHSAVVGLPDNHGNGSSGDIYPQIERFTTVDLVHVTRIEQLPVRTA